MTRFARAKGSKASNEKLPENATSWSDMKQELLHKNQELEEEKEREVFQKMRQSNYQAFLQEKADEEDKKIAWADFPETKNLSSNNAISPKKRKSSIGTIQNGLTSNKKKPKKTDFLEINEYDEDEADGDSDGEFSALKLQIDKVLEKQEANEDDADSDAAPEKVSIKEKPKEIVVKKAKKPKQKLKIVLEKEEQMSKTAKYESMKQNQQKEQQQKQQQQQEQQKKITKTVEKPVENNSVPKEEVEEKVLTEIDKKRLEKKSERYKKQQAKKKLKRKELKEKQKEANPDLVVVEVKPPRSAEEKEQARSQKKLERRKKQKEKKKLKQQQEALNKLSENPQVVAEENNSDSESLPKNNAKAVVETETPKPEGDGEKSRTQIKIEKRKQQKEKKKSKQQATTKIVQGKPKEENLNEEELQKIQKKKEKLARQAEKRKQFKEAKALEAEKNQGKDGENQGNFKNFNRNNNDNVNEGNFNNRNNHNNSNNNTNTFKDNRKFNDDKGPNGDFAEKKFNDRGEQNKDFTERKPFQKLMTNQKQKQGKVRDNKEHASRKSKSEIMFINGKTVEIDYIEGFPVKKEDADRLRQLRKEMISKGLPRSEINVSLKLERRRAEKAFTREKKNVCFNCRKSGHNLSECPELNKDQVAQTNGTGICFKCGSTEHTHFECKVVKGLDYKFASCFICKEQGHIARQCPDNQRGLYPKGGSCKVCGDVTHLKKDCPKYHAQQAQLSSSVNIGTMDSRNPDDLGSTGASVGSFQGPGIKMNKVVKF